MPRNPLTPTEMQIVLDLHAAGLNDHEIASEISRNVSVVRRHRVAAGLATHKTRRRRARAAKHYRNRAPCGPKEIEASRAAQLGCPGMPLVQALVVQALKDGNATPSESIELVEEVIEAARGIATARRWQAPSEKCVRSAVVDLVFDGLAELSVRLTAKADRILGEWRRRQGIEAGRYRAKVQRKKKRGTS